MRPSIARRLQILLIGSVLAIGTLQTWLCYRASRAEADVFHDQHMRLLAEAIAGATRSGSMDPGEIPATSGAAAGFTIRIRPAPDARVRAGNHGQASSPEPTMGFSEASSAGSAAPWRLYRMRTPHGAIIEVAQRVDMRTSMALAMAVETTWPIFALAPLVLLGVWWIVRQSVAPMHRIGRALAARASDDPSQVEDRDVPSEVIPLVDELNRLMARVGGLVASQRRFVADAAHELRSPLTALKLQVQTMLAARPVELSQATKLDRLERGIGRMHRIVEQLLQLSRSELRATTGDDAGPVELGDAVHRIVTELSELAQERRIGVRIAIPDDIRVAVDPDDLATLIANLLDNALKYSPVGGAVEISADHDARTTRLRVLDSGPGIPLAARERVFDRFYRIPGSDVPGSGLGLAIVRTIADRIRAGISFGDSRLGGLAVEVSIPHATERLAPAVLPTAQPETTVSIAESA